MVGLVSTKRKKKNTMSFLEQSFDTTNESKLTKASKAFLGKQDTKYRIGFPAFKSVIDMGTGVTVAHLTPADRDSEKESYDLSPRWIGRETAYAEGLGKIIVGSPEVKKFLESKNIQIKPKFGTVIMSWPLDEDGKVNMKRVMKDPMSVEIEPFVVARDKYAAITGKHKDGLYLWENDFLAALEKGKKDTFQAWVFDPLLPKHGTGCQFRKLLEAAEKGTEPAFRTLVNSLIERIIEATENVLPAMGKEYKTVAEIQAKFKAGKGQSLSETSEVESAAADVNVDALLNSLDD